MERLLEHAGWLRDLARSLVLDDGAADDAVQEVWVAALGAGEVREPRPWLGGTLRKVLASRGRSEARRRGRERRAARGEADVPPASSSLELVERQEELLALVGALPEAQRDAIVARYYEGLAPREIARRTDVAPETVKSRLKRGLESLRGSLDRRHGDRRTWAAHLLPLATTGTRRATFGVGALVAAAAAVAVAGVALVLALGERGGSRAADSPRAVQASPVTVVASEATSAADEVVPADDRVPVVAGETTRVRVLAPGGARAVAGARVVAFRQDEVAPTSVAEAMGDHFDMERLFEEFGTVVHADAGGWVDVPGEPPVSLWASSEEGVRVEVLEGDDREVVLREVAPLVVVVRDADGEPVEGVPVAATVGATMEEEFDDGGGFRVVRTTGASGARFVDPMGFFSSDQPEGFRAAWLEVGLDVPGAELADPGTARRVQVDPRAMEGAPVELALRLPPTAPHVLEVEGLGEVDAFAYLYAADRPGGWTGTRFRADVVAGRATFERVALGQRYRWEVHVPSAGTEWVVETAGPTVAGEPAVARTTRPDRPAVEGRLVTEGGAPFADQRLLAYFPDAGVGRSHRATELVTDGDGRVRVEWEAGEELGGRVCFHAQPVAFTSDGARHRVAFLDFDEAAAGTRDFGTLELPRVPDNAVVARVVDATGAPVAGANAGATSLQGVNWGAETDALGRFRLRGPFPDPVEVQVRPNDGSGRSFSFVVHASDAEHELVLTEGGTVAGSVVLPEALEPARLRFRLTGVRDGAVRSVELAADGTFRLEGLQGGPHRLELGVAGSAPVLVLEELLVPHAGRTLDPRLERLDLAACLRPVEVEGAEGVTLTVWRDEQRDLLAVGPPFFVPRERGFTARFGAPGSRVLTFPEATEVPDLVHFAPEPPIVVRLRLVGEVVEGARLQLSGEPGCEAAGLVAWVPQVPVDGVHEVELPAPGRWRLVRQSPPSGRGEVRMIGLERTAAVLEVADVVGQELELDVEAPAVSAR